MEKIITNRLLLIPMTYQMMKEVIKGEYTLMEEMGLVINGKWPHKDTLDILHFLVEMMDENAPVTGFDAWIIVKAEDMTIIGDAGFKGGPDEDGAVEIGFGLIDEAQRKGYGFEAASGLIQWAEGKAAVKIIKADCLIDNLGSIGVLNKCQMIEVGRDAELIYWEKRLER